MEDLIVNLKDGKCEATYKGRKFEFLTLEEFDHKIDQIDKQIKEEEELHRKREEARRQEEAYQRWLRTTFGNSTRYGYDQ